jgi:hypothetical protein
MNKSESKTTAQNLMTVHGLRATAVVQERIAEARQQGDTAALEGWQNVEAAAIIGTSQGGRLIFGWGGRGVMSLFASVFPVF